VSADGGGGGGEESSGSFSRRKSTAAATAAVTMAPAVNARNSEWFERDILGWKGLRKACKWLSGERRSRDGWDGKRLEKTWKRKSTVGRLGKWKVWRGRGGLKKKREQREREEKRNEEQKKGTNHLPAHP
jgi:hypothetical protein